MSQISSNNDLIKYLRESLGNLINDYKLDINNKISLLSDYKQLSKVIQILANDQYLKPKFITVVATDERPISEKYKLHIIFSCEPKSLIELEIELPKENPSYEAISQIIPSANWSEREIHDLFGIIPLGIDLEPLILHRDWQRGKNYPLRKDFSINHQEPISEVQHQFDFSIHEGMHQIVAGPIHAGIIEPGHLRFSVTGEQIHSFNAQLFYTHKGIEKMAEGKSCKEALLLAEHVCGMCSFAHSVSFAQAIENIAKIKMSERVMFIRMICLELERISSHLADLTAICSSGGFVFGSVHAGIMRENIMRLISGMVGHRFLRGFNAIGGLNRDIVNENFSKLQKDLNKFKLTFREWEHLILSTDSLLDRLELTGILPMESALSLGIVGPAARASGIKSDVRSDLPYLLYNEMPINISVYKEGDALARTHVRVDEIYESLRIINHLIQNLPSGSVSPQINYHLPSQKSGIGIVESAKGSLIHWVAFDNEQKISRWHIRSASYMNWRGMIQATTGKNIVPDGPLVNKSFNLCYACVDR